MSDDTYTGPQQPEPGFTPKDQDPVPELDARDAYEIGPLDWTLIQDQLEEIERNKPLLGGLHSTIDNPDVNPLIGAPRDDRWSYYNEYEQVKKDIELEKIDYEKLSDKFKKNDKKDLTKEEKDAILNKIVWSED